MRIKLRLSGAGASAGRRITTMTQPATKTETKTIMEFLSENPNVDVSRAWERCWKIQQGIVDRVRDRFQLERHPQASEGYWASPDGQLEGEFRGYTGPEVDWAVHSWLGNRKASI